MLLKGARSSISTAELEWTERRRRRKEIIALPEMDSYDEGSSAFAAAVVVFTLPVCHFHASNDWAGPMACLQFARGRANTGPKERLAGAMNVAFQLSRSFALEFLLSFRHPS